MVMLHFAMKFIDTLHALQLAAMTPGLMLEASIASLQDLYGRQRKQGSCESEGTIPQQGSKYQGATTSPIV